MTTGNGKSIFPALRIISASPASTFTAAPTPISLPACGPERNTMPNKYIPQFSAVYYIEAFDFAGNCSEKVAIEAGNEDDPLE